MPETTPSVTAPRASGEEARPLPAWLRLADRLAWLPPLIMLGLIALQYAAPSPVSSGALWLLPLLNLVFSTLISFLVAALAAASWLSGGFQVTVLLGAGVLAFGTSSLLAGIVVPSGRYDAGVAVYNLGVCLGGLLSLAAALRLASPRRRRSHHPDWPTLLAVYGGVLAAMALIFLAAHTGTLPAFFVEGAGPTPLRQAVLGLAVASFAASALVLLRVAGRNRSPFLRWYALGLALIAVGLAGVFGIRSLASLLGWLGRGAQYLGGLYLLAAAVIAVRSSGRLSIPLAALREVRQRYRLLVDSSPDAILVHAAGRLLFANPAAARMLGACCPQDLVGRALEELVHPDSPEEARRRLLAPAPRAEAGLLGRVLLLRPDGRTVETEAVGLRVEYGGRAAVQVLLHDVTERRRIEEAFRRQQLEIEAIYRNAPVGLCVLDTGLRFLRINDRLAEINGRPVEAHLGRTVQEVVPSIAGQAVPGMRRVLETGEPVLDVEITGETAALPGASRTWVESWLPITGADGTVVGINVVAQEITERKRAEEALRESERRWATTLASIGDAVIATDTAGRITFLNAVAERLTGWSLQEARGVPVDRVFRIVNERTRAAVENPVHRVLATGAVVGLANHTVLLPRGGGEVPIDDSGAPIQDEDGRMLGVVLVFRDIAERRLAEQRLGASERRYRTLFASMEAFNLLEPVPDGQGGPADFRYLEVNPAAARLAGLTPEAMEGRTVRELFPGIDRHWLEVFARVAATGEPAQFERFGGTTGRWYRSYVYRTDEGRIASLVLDITERRQAEQALQELTVTLERRVAERTELAESRSRQLQALAVQLIEAEERERRRVAELLHDDLQQLLASARLQLQAAVRGLPRSPLLDSVEQLLGESIRKSRRLSHELSPAVLHHSGLPAALQWLARQMREQFGIEVELELQAAPPAESAPMKTFLFRAAQELLFNAVKHAGVERARVALSDSGGGLRLTISDDGRGFDPGILDSPSGAGGFGLLSLRERTRSIGGTLTIESAPGRGSRFTLAVPVNVAEVVPGRPEPAAGPPPRASARCVYPGHPAGIRVLFADDHRVMRQGLFSMIAGQPGIQVVGEAADGKAALELARELRPDVVVMDISMPVMDGIEATRRIREECPGVRVIGLSMHEDEQLARAMLRSGAEAFLSKTASTGELLKAIYGIVGSGSGTEPLPA